MIAGIVALGPHAGPNGQTGTPTGEEHRRGLLMERLARGETDHDEYTERCAS